MHLNIKYFYRSTQISTIQSINIKIMKDNLEYRRRLPPELLVEMHKCLPLANAIYVLVNVSKTFVINNSTRMHRNIQRIKSSLIEYIDSMIEEEDEEGQNDRKELWIYNDFEWIPKLDALIRYGTWMTSTQRFLMPYGIKIVGVPENFVEDLLLYMTNSSSPQMMLQFVGMNFVQASIPIPEYLMKLLNNKQISKWGPYLFESVELEKDNGQILRIYDSQKHPFENLLGEHVMSFIVVNKMNWFEISIFVDSTKQFIRSLEFTRSEMQPLKENGFEIIGLKNYREENGGKLEAIQNIIFNPKLDIFLRHGSSFTKFRHFQINPEFILSHPKNYSEFLISHISNTTHPEDFLESIELNLDDQCSSFLDEIWKKCFIGVPQGGKSIKCGAEKFYIISAKISDSQKKFEFTLINRPTNGDYLFDVGIKYGEEGLNQIIRIKIRKRKSANIIGMNCIVLAKKREAIIDDEGEEDEPTCSSKIMKK